MSRSTLIKLIAALIILPILWKSFDGDWESRYRTEHNHTFIIDLEATPIWEPPSEPTLADFQHTFIDTEIPEQGTISVQHKWDWWFADIFLVWLIGALILCPLIFIYYKSDMTLGFIARVAGGLILSSLLCFTLWLVFGGWGPPYPLFFAILGLILGTFWATLHRRNCP